MNDTLLNDIINLVTKHSLIGGLGIGVLYAFINIGKTEWFGKIMTKLSDNVINRFIKKKVEDNTDNIRKISESDIINHDIFNYINFWKESKVPTLTFSSEFRTVVFRKYLSIYLITYKTNIQTLISSKKYEKMDQSMILNMFHSLINDTVYDYEKEMRADGIPEIVIEKMKAKNNDSILLTIDLVEGICNSSFYESENNLLKVYSILNIMLSILENTMSNSIPVCDSINGQLKGQKYKGLVE